MSAVVRKAVNVNINDDRRLTLAFMTWMQANQVYTMKNTGNSCGGDFYNGVFDIKHEVAIVQFMSENER